MRAPRRIEAHFTEEVAKDVKRVRQYFKLPNYPTIEYKRNCLKCGREFIANSKFNKMCYPCKS